MTLKGGPFGDRQIAAPAGFKQDDTAVRVWHWAVHYARELRKPQKTKRALLVLEGQIRALAIILANTLGMAAFYWEEKAREFAKLPL